jgi:hypothetical protein
MDGKAYLHLRLILSDSDIADMRLRKSSASPSNRFLIEAYLTTDRGKRIRCRCE